MGTIREFFDLRGLRPTVVGEALSLAVLLGSIIAIFAAVSA